MVGGPPRFVIAGRTKAGKSTLINALLSIPEFSPTDALSATATALYVSSSGNAAEAESVIRVHRRRHGRVITEPRQALVDRYTGRDAEDVVRVEMQTVSRFFLNVNVQFIDTPGFGALGDFGERHSEIAQAEIEQADVHIRLVKTASEIGRLISRPHRPHQPLIVVRTFSDNLVDMSLTSPDVFGALEKEKLQFEASLSEASLSPFYCAPLLALGAEVLEDSILEQILTLSESECLQFLISRGCLTDNTNTADTSLTLSERQSLISEMSQQLLPNTSRFSAWPVWRSSLFLARYYKVDDVSKLREMLTRFSGIRELRDAVRQFSEPTLIRRVRIKRILTEKLKRLKTSQDFELRCLREHISNFAIALDSALCEMTEVGTPVIERLRSEEETLSQRLMRYERSISFLEKTAFSEEPSDLDLDLTWILENDALNALDLEEQKAVIRFLVEEALKLKKKGDAINGKAKADEHDV